MKILVVDDEKLARARMRELIDKEGEHLIVGEAMNGNEAIEKTMDLKPECLLMDIRMPVMDGLEAAMHLQSMDTPPAVIFTTAYDQHALEAFEALRAGSEIGGQELQGDLALECRVLGPVHLTHAARPELLEDSVVADSLADQGRASEPLPPG